MRELEAFPVVMRRSEASRMLGLSETQLSRLAAAGRIPSARIGGARRFLRDELIDWLRRGGSTDAPSVAA